VIVFRVLLKFVWSHRPLFGHGMRGDTSKTLVYSRLRLVTYYVSSSEPSRVRRPRNIQVTR
jgi:hypothetical protein